MGKIIDTELAGRKSFIRRFKAAGLYILIQRDQYMHEMQSKHYGC